MIIARCQCAGTVLALLIGFTALVCPVAAQVPVHWSLALAADDIRPGQTIELNATAEIDPRWHLYATTQPAGGPQPLVISLSKEQPFSLAGPVDSDLPQTGIDPNFHLETLFFEERAVFTLPIHVAPSTQNGVHRLAVTISYQTCNDKLCLPPEDEELLLDVVIGPRAPGTNISTVPEPQTARATAPLGASRVPDMAAASAGATTLPQFLSLALVMGALSLFTPCVFPMVPITVSFFTNRIRHNRRDGVTHAVAYGLAIVLTFTAVGVTIALAFGASGLNRFAADPWLNLGVTALFVLFALNLFGIYELALPSRLMKVAARAGNGHGRFAGTMMMGLAFTLTSFTCTAPFLGTLFVVASQGDWQWPLMGMLAFSIVFAIPFVVLALAPQLVAALPRSGPWLIGVKATMGLLELAAAMKFLSNADLVWGWNLFTRPVVITAWIAIAALLALYFAGGLRLGRAPRLGRPGLARLCAAAGCVFLAVWLASGLSGRRLGELDAFLPPADLRGVSGTELLWFMNDYQAALAEAHRLQRPILVDFTGYTCTNCRWMEANMFPKPAVTRELARYVRVRLFTDGRGDIYKQHQQMEQDWFGTVALPFYAVLTASGDPVVSFGGLTRDSDEYLRFLRRGLE